MSARRAPRIYRITSHGAVIMIFLGALQSAVAYGASRVSSMSIEDLKGVYLGCEQMAAASKPNGGEVMHCSLIYD